MWGVKTWTASGIPTKEIWLLWCLRWWPIMVIWISHLSSIETHKPYCLFSNPHTSFCHCCCFCYCSAFKCSRLFFSVYIFNGKNVALRSASRAAPCDLFLLVRCLCLSALSLFAVIVDGFGAWVAKQVDYRIGAASSHGSM